ncbi:DUF5011 domain-containing protein [Enterovibrio sp. ZSDZ42]|uniref:DUF5011 domain-containing protein n=1 Tax=Enterovibrio gelatinilyticus TaxID=2899819 RepID=A0ABT5R541_9GAMM|nr:glycoside hydrolase family 19 protein [Enterovibrio sp. ZSDZ42]MDD1794861.1 DUF5011 domain-containing protein [Enterovibrio sp. ZSDZ42]
MKHSVLASAIFSASFLAQAGVTMNPQPDPDNPGGYVLLRSEVQAAESMKVTDPMYDVWAQALRTESNAVVDAIDSGLASNPDNVKRAERVFTSSDWQFLTQMAAPEYTYTRFLKAIGKFPAFCGDYTDGRDADAICKKSIITAFAHFSQETGGHIAVDNVWDNPLALEEWQQALVHVREMGWSEGQEGYTTGCGQTDWQNARWPCAAGQGYFGRGAKQLSYHFNYGPFSEVMFDGDATVLLNNPALVADSWLNLASAIWFFLTPQAPKPAMLHVIDRTWAPSQRETDAGIGYGFGTTINIINGGIECGEQNKDKGQPVNRIRYWEGLAAHYQIPIEADEANTCWQQTPYGSLNLNGATDVLYTNWEQDYTYTPGFPVSFQCKLVGYQTAYSALVPGDYEACVTNKYGSHQGYPSVRVIDDAGPVTGKPVFNGVDNTSVRQNAAFNPLDGVSASDKEDGSLTASIVVEGAVDTTRLGTTGLVYSVTDADNNVTTANRTVEVFSDKPVFVGTDNASIKVGAAFNALSGVSASDTEDGDLTSAIKVMGQVDTATVGTYTLTYSVADSANQSVSVLRTVEVTSDSVCVVTAWDSTSTYNTGDVVSHAGKTWKAGWWTQGKEPGTTGPWGVWTETSDSSCGGDVTPNPDPTPTPTPDPEPTPTPDPTPDPTPGDSTWNATAVYGGGDQVTINGVTYQAKYWTQGDDPTASGEWGPWQVI